MRAALFDVFGTLLDVYSVTRRAEQMFPGYGARLALLWRDKQLDYSRLRALGGHYENFSRVTRDALEYSLETLKLPGGETVQVLLDEYRRLAPFIEVAPALQRMQQAGVRLGVLSNGDADMLEAALVSSGLHPYFDLVLSAEQVRMYKPAPSIYALGPRALKMAPADILFVSANCWDACGAAWYGYTSFWVNRLGLPLERLGTAPHNSGSSLADSAEYLLRNLNTMNEESTE